MTLKWIDLVFGVDVRFVGSIQELGRSIVGVGDQGDHPTKEIFPEEENNHDSPPVEVFCYFPRMLHQTL